MRSLFNQNSESVFGCSDVKCLQAWLNGAGYAVGRVDGDFGNWTAKALQRFLVDVSFLFGWVDGDFGPRSVKALQAFLIDIGFLRGWMDGHFGERTANAVKRFLNQSAFAAKALPPDLGVHSWPCDPCERRVAGDGHAYTLQTFKEWYTSDWQHQWQRARPVILVQVPPEGLTVANISTTTTRAALSELQPCFAKHPKSFEMGWGIDHVDKKVVPAVAAGRLEDFPRVCELIMQVMEECDDHKEIWPRIQITVQRYYAGRGLGLHVDRPEWYEDCVYGCVLINSSDSELEFHKAGECFISKESQGSCFRMEGTARYHWKHGVPPLTHGDRVSVSWRWFTSESCQ